MTNDVDALAQEIRRVDGNHKLGAGTLAEALMPFLTATSEQPEPVAWSSEEALFDRLCAVFRANLYDHPNKSVLEDSERTLAMFAGAAAEALYTQPSKQTGGGGEPTMFWDASDPERGGDLDATTAGISRSEMNPESSPAPTQEQKPAGQEGGTEELAEVAMRVREAMTGVRSEIEALNETVEKDGPMHPSAARLVWHAASLIRADAILAALNTLETGR